MNLLERQVTGFLATPPLWENTVCEISQFNFPTIADIQIKPIPENIRLGHQVEHIFKQLLDCSKLYDVVLNNVPVRNSERTLGEIDFILRNKKTDKLLHVELTYKFYLVANLQNPITALIGPNRGDSFIEKNSKIVKKQFKLIHSNECIKILNNNNLNNSEIKQESCFKAQLFTPFKTNTRLNPFNEKCVVGYWIYANNFATHYFLQHLFYVPTKREWIVAPHENVPWKNHETTAAEILLYMKNKKSPMLWMKTEANRFEKLFVVWW